MSGSKRKRRDARRRARERRGGPDRDEARQEEATGASGEAAGEEREPARAAASGPAAAGGGHSRAARKRSKRRDSIWARVGRMHVSPWLVGAPIVATVIVVIVVLVLTSGSSGTSSGAQPSPTVDPRVAGQTPAASRDVGVNDVNFDQTQLSGDAGEVIEFLVTNTGTISHNMVFAGPDDEYDTADDFEPQPFAIQPGETGRVVLKIDDPGSYRFRCAFHPNIEFGTLTLQ